MIKISPYTLHNKTMSYIDRVSSSEKGHLYQAPRLFAANLLAIATAASVVFAELLKLTLIQPIGLLANAGIRTIRIITKSDLGDSALRQLPGQKDFLHSARTIIRLTFSISVSLTASIGSIISPKFSQFNTDGQLQSKLFEPDVKVPPPNLQMNELMKFYTKGDRIGNTVLEYPNSLKANLPILLDKLSTADLKIIFSRFSSSYIRLDRQLTKEMVDSLSKTHCLRLTAVLDYIYLDPDLKELDRARIRSLLPSYAQEFANMLDFNETTEEVKALLLLPDLNEEEQNAAIANYIELKKIPLLYVLNQLGEDRFLRLGPHLRYANFSTTDPSVIPLFNELLRNSPNINQLYAKFEASPDLQGDLFEDVADLPNCQSFKISYFNNLRHLPALNQCKIFEIERIDGLQVIPDLPLCEEFICYSCPDIGTSPALLKCKVVRFKFCFRLTALTELPECKGLTTTNCPQLEFLPAALPECRWFNYSHCPLIREYPQLPFEATVICESSTPFNTFKVHVERLNEEPLALLRELGKLLLAGQAFPNIHFLENNQRSEGLDAGGLRRDFVTRLCEILFKENGDPTKFLTRTKDFLPVTNSYVAEEVDYKTLGVIFALCYVGSANMKTGPLFNPQVYEYLTAEGKPGSDEWKAACDRVAVRHYFRSEDLSDKMIQALIYERGALPRATKKELQTLAFVDSEDDADLGKFDQDYLVKNREQIKDKMLSFARAKLEETNTLRALSWIAETMKQKLGNDRWATLKVNGAEALQEAVEGFVDGPSLKAHLEWNKKDSVTAAKLKKIQGFLTTWIDNASIEKLYGFVRFVTGCKTLSAAKLKMEVHDCAGGRIPAAHTCIFSLDLSGNCQSQEQFNETLDTAILNGLNGTGFTFA